MATSRDSSARSFLKKAGKYAGRAHEKMLQKMGKVDDTKDESFQRYVTNFNAQHASAVKLQREVHRYLETMKGWHLATKSLLATSAECYEREWEGRDNFQQAGEQFGLLGEDVLQTVRVQLVEQLDHYVAKFADLKAQVNKRERKLLDHQRTKRELETIKGKEKSSDVKIQKAEEAYEEAERLYKEVNEKMHEELPNFYDSRVHIYASAFQGFAQAHTRFFEEATKLSASMLDIMTKLEEEAENYVTAKLEPSMEQSANSNGVDPCADAEAEIPELKVTSEPEVERSSPVPPPVQEEDGPPEGNSPSRDSKSSTPSGSSGDDDGTKTGSLRRSPPAKPTRPESFSPADSKSRPSVEVKAKPPTLTEIVGTIKPPAMAKNADKEEDGKEMKEEVLPATGEEGQGADDSAAEEKMNEPPLQPEDGERVEKDETTGERVEQKVEKQPEVERQEQADSGKGAVEETAALEAHSESLSHEQEQPEGGVAAHEQPEGGVAALELGGEAGSVAKGGDAEQLDTPPVVEDVPAEKGGEGAEKGNEGTEQGEESAEKTGEGKESVEKGEEGAEKGEGGAEQGEESAEKGEEGAEQGEESAEKGEEGAEQGEESAEKGEEGAEQGEESAEKGEEGAEQAHQDKGQGGVGKRGEQAEKGEEDAEKGEGAKDTEKGEAGAEKGTEKGGEGVEKREGGNENTNQPHPGVTVLYKVRAVHPYSGVDEDELTLEPEDIISVIPYEDPEEQDEGWLMGICERTGNKGVFPLNFTTEITS